VYGPAIAADHTSDITVMTQNMDDGTDLTYIVAASLGYPLSLADAVDLTYAELQASSFGQRAGLMAQQIASRKPDILALQEATLWRTGASPAEATVPLFDQIALLMAALDKAGTPYDLIAVNVVNDLALAGNQVPALRLTDRNALLVRSDLRPPAFNLSDVHTNLYSATFPFGQFQISAGWIAATVHTGNTHFRLMTTHLQSPIEGVPAATTVQVAQAQELIHELRNVTDAVVVCGDFNSDANHGGLIDDTPSVNVIESAGYAEVWPMLHAGDAGLTWPLYTEDGFPPGPFFGPASPVERIDLFFERGMQILSIDQVLAPVTPPPTPPFSAPPYGSDHTGVIAVLRP